MINVDGSNERKIDVVDKQPEALSVFKVILRFYETSSLMGYVPCNCD